MFLRATKRFKDGKVHYYWSMVENVRVGRRVFQRQALYLGELNDSQREEWQRAVEALDEKGNVRQLKLFPEDRAPETDDGQVVRIRMDRLTVRNVRNWGEVWLGRELWDKLGLDGFWASRLGPSRKGTDWLALMKAIVLYRFTDPGSELRMHTNWLANTAVEELIGPGALTGRSTLYSCLDRVIWNSDEWKKPRGERKGSFKDEFFYFLRDRWAGLFGSTCDVVLFDLTSTYFEVDGTKALESDLQRYGYSRDKRGDCLQVVVALVLTPDGFPLAYEVMPGNTSDKGTQMQFVDRLVKKYGKDGKLDSLWLMDRGVPTEDTLEKMRSLGFKYLVGSPRSTVGALGEKLSGQEWTRVQDGIRVKYAADGTDKYVLTHSMARFTKEHAMRQSKMRAVMKVLHAIDVRIGRRVELGDDDKPVEKDRKALSRDELISRLAVAKSKAGRAWGLFKIRKPKPKDTTVTQENFSWSFDLERIKEARGNEGTYLLRTNMTEADPAVLWKQYMIQGEIEQSFKEVKNDLGLRPVYHQLDSRIEAHIFVSYVAYCLQATLKNLTRSKASGLTPRQIFDKMKKIYMVDVKIPTTDGREIVMQRYGEPKDDVALVLSQLGLRLPPQPPPKIDGKTIEEAQL